ncbi:MAG: hypothetical protein B6229_03485 [Spirochaetaceae bacterium 4572_7]|nr:MAG: hypothetical protein B6229_03485 [Spirochaetaceae bacterium 4572_7]
MEFYLKVRVLVNSWIIYTAFRHFKTKRREKGDTSTILSIVGILSGVMTMITVIGVMNGFQGNNIDKKVEIGSGHIVLEPIDSKATFNPETVSLFPEVDSIYMSSTNITASTDIRDGEMMGLQVCSVPDNILDIDKSFKDMIGLKKGSFDLSGENTIVIGQSLSYRLRLNVGDKISLLSLTSHNGNSFEPKEIEFSIVGVYRSGSLEYDETLAFISNDSAMNHFTKKENFTYKIKIKNRNRYQYTMNKISKIDGLSSMYSIKSWRDYNTSYYNALKNEKDMMIILIGLIFLVVGVNIYNSLRRSVYLRFEEISVLKTMGVSSFDVRVIFILESFFIGFIGATIGVVLGLSIANNINAIFDVLEVIINNILSLFNGSSVSLYGSQFFYISKVPVKVFFNECFMVFIAAIFTSIIAAYGASKRISSIKPGEVIRNE